METSATSSSSTSTQVAVRSKKSVTVERAIPDCITTIQAIGHQAFQEKGIPTIIASYVILTPQIQLIDSVTQIQNPTMFLTTLAGVRHDGLYLQGGHTAPWVEDNRWLRDNDEIAEEAMRSNARVYTLLSARLRDNKRFARMLVECDTTLFRCVSLSQRDNEELASYAVSRDPSLLAYVSTRLQNKEEIARLAVERNPSMIQYVDDEELAAKLLTEISKTP